MISGKKSLVRPVEGGGYPGRCALALTMLALATLAHPLAAGDLADVKARGKLVVVNSLTITDDRRGQVDFTEPYFEGAEAIVVRSKSPVKAAADLTDKKCAAGRGTSQLEALKTLLPGAQRVEVDFPLQAYVEVDEGTADCAIAETGIPVGGKLKPPYPPLEVAFVLRKYQYGMAVRKGSDLLEPLNAYLDGLKRSGELQRIADAHGVSELGWITAPAKP